MTQLTWRETGDGYECDGYRIRDLGPARFRSDRWSLEVIDLRGSRQGVSIVETTLHRTLRAAKEQAARDERLRVRQARMSGHLFIGGGALLALVAVASFRGLAAFVAVVVLMYVGLGSLADAMWIWMNDVWGSTKPHGGPAPMTWSDRIVLAIIERAHRRRIVASRQSAPAIRILSPQPIEVDVRNEARRGRARLYAGPGRASAPLR